MLRRFSAIQAVIVMARRRVQPGEILREESLPACRLMASVLARALGLSTMSFSVSDEH